MAKQRQDTTAGWLLVAILGVFAYCGFGTCGSGRGQSESSESLADTSPADSGLPPIDGNDSVEETKLPTTSSWVYEESADPMGRGTIKTAVVVSTNEVSFGFPYEGAQKAVLMLRRHPKHGKDIILKIEKGQFIVGVDGCTVEIKFDNGKPRTYWANEPADYDTTVLFIRGYDRFVAAARKAKKVSIEVGFYQEGQHVFEFNIPGLKW